MYNVLNVGHCMHPTILVIETENKNPKTKGIKMNAGIMIGRTKALIIQWMERRLSRDTIINL